MKTKLLLVFAFFIFQCSFAKELFADPVTPIFSPLEYCDPNNDGFGEFDLDMLTPAIIFNQSGSASDYVVTYHETANDAEAGVNPISSPYFNTTPWNQTVNYRIRNINTNAYAVGIVGLTVKPIPEATTPTDISVCDNNNDGLALFDFTPLIPQILGTIDPATVSVSFYTSLAQADAGISPIAPINSYVGTNGQTIFARVSTILNVVETTSCYDIVSFQLHVEPLPLAMSSYPEYALCDSNAPAGFATFDLSSRVSSILMGQTGVAVAFYNTQADALNGSNAVPNNFVNTSNPQTLWIRLTNQETGCFSISTMDIRVNPLPNLIPPISPYTVCDDNQDGFSVFDLTSLVPNLIQGSEMNVTFHETQMEAEIGSNPLSSPYYNINPFLQMLYVRGSDAISGCYSVMQIELHVNPLPMTPISLDDIQVCDADSNPLSATTLIDLTQQSAEILTQQPLPASNYTVTYYNSQSDAEVGTSTIIPATNYFGADGEMIWFRVETNLTGCYAVGSFHLIINTPLALTTPTPLKVCDSDANPNDQFTVFDLTINDSEITQGTVSSFVTYYPSFADAQNGTNAITNPTAYINVIPAVQTVGVRVTSPSGCVSITTLEIRVMSVPAVNTNLPALVPQCDVNNTGDMLEVFDLTVNEVYIMNGNPNLTFHYFPTFMDAEINNNEILTPTAALVSGNVWIRVENNSVDLWGNHCYVLVEQPLTVNPLPNVDLISNNTLNTVYVDGSNNVVQPLTLDAQLYGGYNFEWKVDGEIIPDATFSTYTVNTASPTGQSRVFTVTAEDLDTGCPSSSVSITVLQSSGTPSPLGIIIQGFNQGDTLADLDVNGSNILWYSSAANKNPNTMFSTPLPLSTLLVDNTTYYASQTIGGIESIARLPVTVRLTLGTPDNERVSLQFAPNPVKNSLALQSVAVLRSVAVYTMLWQKVFEQDYNNTDITIDLSNLAAGNYILQAQGETGQKTIRIIKE